MFLSPELTVFNELTQRKREGRGRREEGRERRKEWEGREKGKRGRDVRICTCMPEVTVRTKRMMVTTTSRMYTAMLR